MCSYEEGERLLLSFVPSTTPIGREPVRSIIQTATAVALISAGTATAVHADEVLVSSNITTSTTWTSDNTYNLQGQIYVLPGATLTIQAGTVVASDTGGGGSLAVTKGARIFVNGTRANPVIMTSKADVATWGGGRDGEGKDSRLGAWREGVNEWGNLTIMGSAYISEDATPGNTAVPDPDNVAAMEGLVNGPSTDLYGGGDDDDNSGSISFLSLRFGGRVVNLNNELNGLSLGGVGRDTDIRFVDIMNNVDDGIEIWGGCVNIKYFNIWNVGDDSFDVDQGWRGQAQFGLIVQGFSTNDSQGSGVGDNICETDEQCRTRDGRSGDAREHGDDARAASEGTRGSTPSVQSCNAMIRIGPAGGQ